MTKKKILIFYYNGSKKNFLKANPEKYHSLFKADKNSSLRVVQLSITNNTCESKNW